MQSGVIGQIASVDTEYCWRSPQNAKRAILVGRSKFFQLIKRDNLNGAAQRALRPCILVATYLYQTLFSQGLRLCITPYQKYQILIKV